MFIFAAMLLIALCWMGQAGTPVISAPETTWDSGAAVLSAGQVQAPGDAWFGTPPPTPGRYVRATDDYRAWKERFTLALAQLERRHNTAEAAALREWLAGFEAAVVRRAEQADVSSGVPVSSLFARRAIRRLIDPPPVPAYERFYGYKIVFPWNRGVYTYEADAVPLDSPFLLHENGVKDGGTPVRRRKDIHLLFACAGVTDPVAKNVLIKVSGREGGFDAINTWDTGYVSVGFIQFTTGENGAGSLLHVLQRMKTDEARLAKLSGHEDEFKRYFAEHGIDVRGGQLCVRDPATGEEKYGADAVKVIIDDKRMTAVFQDAGMKSWAFKLAQIREARGAYYLADAPFRIPAAEIRVYETAAPAAVEAAPDASPISAEPRLVKRRCVYGPQAVQEALAGSLSPVVYAEKVKTAAPGTILRVAQRLPNLVGTYGDVLSTEGGQVTLTDRAVQHGVRSTMELFATSINALTPDHPLTLEELRQSQHLLIAKLKNRIDVLAQVAPPNQPIGN